MCYSLTDSVVAFVVNIISSCILYIKSNGNAQIQVTALFFAFVGVMQFWDIIFWSFPPQIYGKINGLATKMAMIWNHLEPIILSILIWIYMGKLGWVSFVLICIYSLCSGLYTISIWKSVKHTDKCCNGNSLFWEWNYRKYATHIYLLFIITSFVLFYENFSGNFKILVIFYSLWAFLFSKYKYSINRNTGRFWCTLVAFAPLLFIITI